MERVDLNLENELPTPRLDDQSSGLGGPNLDRASNYSERHNDSGDVIRDIIIGFADSLTVPFALTAGLSL